MVKKKQKEQGARTPPPPRIFVGREKELSQLSDFIKQEGNRPVVITGMGSIGKTALALNIFNTVAVSSDKYWIDLYSDPHRVADEFRRLFDVLKKRTSKKEFLVVIDGAERVDKDTLLPQILNLQQRFKNIKFLITSRQSLDIENERRLDLQGLSRQEALGLIRDAIGDSVAPETEEELYNVLQGHPLALELAAAFLKAHSPEELIRILKSQNIEPNRSESKRDTRIIQTVRPVILTANDYIIEQLKKSPRDVYKLSSRKFEEVIAELLKGMGWDVKLTQATRDGGMDILAYMMTQLGPLLCLVEAKQYREDRPVGVSFVRTLYGTLFHEQANSALLVTTSSFTRDAREFQREHEYQIGLKDYFDLLDWIGKHKIPS